MTQSGDLSWFSEILLARTKNTKIDYDLSGENEIFTIEHPALIKCRHLFENSPQNLTLRNFSHGWYLDYRIPETSKVFRGFPFEIGRFINEDQEAVLDFKHLGQVFLTKEEVLPPNKIELKHHLMPLWLDYALCTELWGPAGKWTRFHERLHTVLENNGLLAGEDLAGYYPLKREVCWLETKGFRGQISENQYDLILPWDFPLSGLIELENVLSRGP